MHAPSLSSPAVYEEALESELLLQHMACSPTAMSPLPVVAAAKQALSSIDDENDLAWLLPLLDADSSVSATAPRDASSPHLSEWTTSDIERVVGSSLLSELTSDDCTSSNSSSCCASPLERSDDSLDEWSPLTHRLSPSSTAAAGARSTDRAKKPVFASTHARQKHEKKVLTQEALELEATLERLQARARASASSTQSLARVAREAPAHLAWTQVAAAEQSLLERSVRSNKRLRDRVDEHKRLSKSLQRMLLDRATRAALLSEQVLRPSASTATDLSHHDITRLRDMIRELDHLRATAGTALEALEADAPAHGAYRHWQAVQSDGSEPARLRVVSCDEIPFDGSQITRALERYRKRMTPGYRCWDPQRFGGPHDVLVVEEVARAFAPLGAQRYRHRRASRSFTHGARAVTVSVAYIESVDVLGHATPDFLIKVQTYITGREHTHVDDATGERALSTSVQSFTTLTPVTVHDASKAVRTGARVVDSVLMPLWDREFATRVQQLENLLVNTHIHA